MLGTEVILIGPSVQLFLNLPILIHKEKWKLIIIFLPKQLMLNNL